MPLHPANPPRLERWCAFDGPTRRVALQALGTMVATAPLAARGTAPPQRPPRVERLHALADGRLLAVSDGGALWLADSDVSRWTAVPLPAHLQAPAIQTSGGAWLAPAEGGVARSVDAGRLWKLVALPAPQGGAPRPRLLRAGGGGAWFCAGPWGAASSRDDGATWTAIDALAPPHAERITDALPAQRGLFVRTARHVFLMEGGDLARIDDLPQSPLVAAPMHADSLGSVLAVAYPNIGGRRAERAALFRWLGERRRGWAEVAGALAVVMATSRGRVFSADPLQCATPAMAVNDLIAGRAGQVALPAPPCEGALAITDQAWVFAHGRDFWRSRDGGQNWQPLAPAPLG